MATKSTVFKTAKGAAKELKKLGVDFPVFKSGMKEGLPKLSLDELQALYNEYFSQEEKAAENLAKLATKNAVKGLVSEHVAAEAAPVEEVIVPVELKKESTKSTPVFHRRHVRVHPMTFKMY